LRIVYFRSCPTIQYIERIKKTTLGFGSLGDTDSNIAEKIAQERMVELRKEVEFIVTACPTCTLIFNGCEV